MSEQTITCQSCGSSIPLSTALTKQIETSVEARLKLEVETREREARAAFEQELARERVRIEREAKDRVSSAFCIEVEDLRAQVTEKDQRLREAVQAELELRQRQRALAERERTMELEVARRLDQQAKELVTAAEIRATESLHGDLCARDRQIEMLSRQLEDMNRRLQQGSQQVQGEVAESRLEELLAVAFPEDAFEPVPTGVRGADLCQVVRDAAGRSCGRIVWESKQTKAWSDGWLQKLRDDQALLRGDVGVIVSRALPEGITQFELVDGVWITSRASVVALAAALREGLREVARARRAVANQHERQELLYTYVTSPAFSRRVQGLADALVELQTEIEKERRSTFKALNKRETIIRRAVLSVAGMYGDFQGYSGAALPEVPAFQLPGADEAIIIDSELVAPLTE